MKKRLNVKRVVICLLIVFAAIAAVTCLIINKKGNNPINNNYETMHTNGTQSGRYLEILMDDCSLYTGTVVTLKCDANPKKLLDDLSWSSSDEEIAVIDRDGRMTVVGTGTTIITVTNGLVTDSIIVIGIDRETSSVENATKPMLPVLVPGESGELVTESPVVPSETERATDKETEPSEKPTQTESQTQTETEPSTDKEEPSSDEVLVTEPVTTPAAETEQAEDIDYKCIINSEISSLGYTRYNQDYVYIYEEDGNYLGQVIINDASLQISVKTRTTGFDESLKSLIALVFPEDYNTVYSAFVKAEDNKTIKVHNHIIRIRPSGGENHALLIISY